MCEVVVVEIGEIVKWAALAVFGLLGLKSFLSGSFRGIIAGIFFIAVPLLWLGLLDKEVENRLKRKPTPNLKMGLTIVFFLIGILVMPTSGPVGSPAADLSGAGNLPVEIDAAADIEKLAEPKAEDSPQQAEPKTVEEPIKKCPSCDDGNICTQDFCSSQTNFECVNKVLSPCCGDDICEPPEDVYKCDLDCKCTNECTLDKCDGFEFISCKKQSDGCYDKADEGAIIGKCDVKCTLDNDCSGNEECDNYECVSEPEPDFDTEAGNTAKAAELSNLFKEAGQEDGTLIAVYVEDSGSLVQVILMTTGLDYFTLNDLIRLTVSGVTYKYPDTAVIVYAYEGNIKVGEGEYSRRSQRIDVEIFK